MRLPGRIARARRSMALGVLGLLSACAVFTEPFLFPPHASRFEPPGQYAAWWRATEQCSGLRAGRGGIAWYTVPGDAFADADGQLVRGSWQGRGAHDDRIFLAASGTLDGPLVRHEMLHALMARNFERHGHAREYYLERCGGVVSCGPECRAQTGAYEQPRDSDPAIAVAALERTIRLSRDEIADDVDGGWVAVTVSAHNPLPRAGWVLVPPHSVAFPFVHFGLRIDDLVAVRIRHPDLDARVPIGPGETVRFVLDVESRALAPGPRRLRGAALGDSTPVATLVVRR